MDQLSATDASFLYSENERTANHVGGMYIYDQSTAPGGLVTFKGILSHLAARLHLVPRYRQKLMHVPGNLDHPYWIDDPKFDIEYHVRHMALPKPGDWRQLLIQTSRLYDRPLDMARPLWVLYVIEGLDNVEGLPPGSFAVVTKTHHALIDGVSGTAMATAIHETTPDAPDPDPVAWTPEKAPTEFELLTRSYLNNLGQPMKFMQLMGEVSPAAQRLLDGLSSSRFKVPEAIGQVPRTRFNGNVSGHRVLAATSFPIKDLREIKNTVAGATINDVILTIGGGALRRYLLDKNELPDKPLITLSPIAVRASKDPTSSAMASAPGNEVTGMLVSLATDLKDPLARLQSVHDSAANSKELTSAIGAKLMTDFTQFVPSVTAGLASRLASTLGLATRVAPIVNTVLTNVPGPQMPLYFCGAEMVNQYSLGIVQDGMTLFHGILSYNGKLSITAMSDREVMPDPAFYQECLEEAFRELKTAALGAAAGAPGREPLAAKPPAADKRPARKGKAVKSPGK
ncbi:wax ester/triacylglycerol synthase family O-acyltransferase [Emcibacter sp. SYSU 3D8]|uniref:WS/DGAT/MGAT family O-acyltransferase n=1 Tax=Emcibacter sp. SYSU 3D8 TaxID=3133969 RepID=UPI0031FEA752